MMSQIRRLMFVSDAPHFGGAERYVANMVAAARRRRIDVTVCWIKPQAYTSDVFAEACARGAELTVLPAERTTHLSSLFRELRDTIRGCSPDAMIVNACGRARFWAVPWIGRLERIPSLWVHHMVDQSDYRRLAPSRLGGRVEGLHLWRWSQALRHRLAAAGSSAVVALNEQDRTQIAREQGVRRQRIHVVSNGIDTDQYRFDPRARSQVRQAWIERYGWTCDEPFILGTAGRLVHGKGIEMLIQVGAVLRGRGLPVRLVVAGDGPDLQRLLSIAAKVGIADSVALLGMVNDMAGFYSGLDAFALGSSTESFGLVLAEAMACERAVVATPTAGARAQIDSGLTGLLLNSYSADDLGNSVTRLLQQPHLREQLGCNARRRVVREFSLDVCFERTLGLLATPSAQSEPVTQPGSPSAMEEAA